MNLHSICRSHIGWHGKAALCALYIPIVMIKRVSTENTFHVLRDLDTRKK